MTANHGFANERTGAEGPVLFWAAAALLVFAPLVRGGNRPAPLLVLEILGLAILATAILSRPRTDSIPPLHGMLRWGIGLLVAYPLFQLVPLPYSLWSALPGMAPYAEALVVAGETGWRPIALNPGAAQYSWLVMIPCLAVFAAARRLSSRSLRTLVLVFAAVAVVEAALGILQTGAGRDSWLQLGNPHGGGAATGSYVNRNHFAALMAISLPALLGFWAAETLPRRDPHGDPIREHPRNADQRLARRIAWSLALALVLAALLFTRSRAGIGCGLAAFGATTLFLVWSASSIPVRIALASTAAAALLLAAYAGLTPIVERFAPDELALGYEGRWRIASAALRAGLDFLPFGSGLGSFADVFRRYQDAGLIGFVDHAHNDYAEAFLELGVAAVVAGTLLGGAYLLRWPEVAARRASRRLGMLQVASGIAMLALLVHGAFDFNFHIPANAIYFSFLAGVFFHDPRAGPAESTEPTSAG